MSCVEIRPLLALFAGQDVGVEERVAVQAHVAQCHECAAELEDYRGALAALRATSEALPEPGPELADRVVQAVMADRRRGVARWGIVTVARWAALFLVGLGVGWAAGMLWPRGESPAERGDSVPETAWNPGEEQLRPVPLTDRDTSLGRPVAGGDGAAPLWRPLRSWPQPADVRGHYLPRAEVIPVRTGWIRM